MTIIANVTNNSVVLREPGPAGAQGIPGSSVRYQAQIIHLPIVTISGIVQNVYSPVVMSGTFDSGVASGIVVGSGFSLRNNTNATLIFNASAVAEATAHNNENLGLRLTKNGVTIANSETGAHVSNSSAASLLIVPSFYLELAHGHEVGLAVTNFSANVNISLQRTRLTLSAQ